MADFGPGAGGYIRDLAGGLAVSEWDGAGQLELTPPGVVRLAVHRGGVLPTDGLEHFDILLSADRAAPRPWVGAGDKLDAAIADLRGAIALQPAAAAICAQVHRVTLGLPFAHALVLESLAYSMLLASAGLKAWRAAHPARMRGDSDQPRVRVSQGADGTHIVLTRAQARNAVDAAMRDALVDAFEVAVLDPDAAPVILSGEGPAFSAGGDLDEFGSAADPGVAHLIRVQQAPINLLHQIAPRVTARVHGACVGAGIELPAAAGRVVAAPDAFFRLPEVAMGLIPGAGGTASIPRRIGRHRACYMAISGHDVDPDTALAWGLVDAVETWR